MSIIETEIPNWNTKIDVKQLKYPQTKDEYSPKNFFVAIFAGSRGTGKSFLATKLIKSIQDKGVYDEKSNKKLLTRVILISPTAHSPSNNFFECLNIDWENDVIEEYKDNEFDDKIKEIKDDQKEAENYQKYKQAYEEFEKIDDVNKMSNEKLMLLYERDFLHYDEIEQPKFKDKFITYILVDDCVSTSALKKGRSRMTYHALKNRHTGGGFNLIFCVQNIMEVPKSIRVNSNYIAVFRFANKEIVINDICDNISGFIKADQFEKLYDYAVKDNIHDPLIINTTNSKPIFMKGLDKVLTIREK